MSVRSFELLESKTMLSANLSMCTLAHTHHKTSGCLTNYKSGLIICCGDIMTRLNVFSICVCSMHSGRCESAMIQIRGTFEYSHCDKRPDASACRTAPRFDRRSGTRGPYLIYHSIVVARRPTPRPDKAKHSIAGSLPKRFVRLHTID